ncbi:MAG: aminoacyl-tRNA hydrolase [Patescibacteria group bacterium]|nr:aminoacyl-tRNA hydrolase [Patescibacteria group bacterium]
MKLVVGLGNPGEKYKNTRHNAGFWVVDELAGNNEWKKSKSYDGLTFSGSSTNSSPQRSGLKGVPSRTDLNRRTDLNGIRKSEELLIIKPQLFMNKSGVVVKAVFKKHSNKFKVTNLKNMWVVHDDLDIKLGKFKISFGKGPKTHNGLKSIYEQIGTKDFWHVRVGIDDGGFRESGEGYVLSSWRLEERKIINQVVEKVVKELKNVLA